MTRKKFIKLLENNSYEYEIKKRKLIVIGSISILRNISFDIESLPSGVEFKNVGNVKLDKLKKIPKNLVFNNAGGVILGGLESIHKGVRFNNKGSVELLKLKSIPIDMEFHNKGLVYTADPNIINLTGGIDIEGIKFNRLFNLMIKRGIFLR